MILTVGHYLRAGFRGWPWLIVGAVLVAAFMVWSAVNTPVYYEARIAFVVNANQGGGGGGGIGALVGKALGGGGPGANLYRIKSFVTSRQLLNDLFLREVEVDGRTDLMANHLIEVGELVEEWELDSIAGPVRISGDSLAGLPRRERSLLKSLYNYVSFSGERPVYATVDEVTDMIVVRVKTRNEDLTLQFCEHLFQDLTDFYTNEATTPARITVERLSQKADSVLTALNAAEYQLASFVDTRLSLNNQRDQLNRLRLNRKITVLSTAYAEIVRNVETARFSLDATTPYFKLVEAPFQPLNVKRKDPYEAAVLGVVLGALLGFILVIGVRFYQDIMTQKEIGI